MNLKDNKLVKYFVEAKAELRKVTWPSRKETVTYTLVVISMAVGVSAFLAAIDFGLNKALEVLISRT